MIGAALGRTARRGLLLGCACLWGACAARAHAGDARLAAAPVELELAGADGRPLEVAGLRGQPLLLFVFTTYDDACQLALVPLERWLHAHPAFRVLGVAVQPSAKQLLPLYREALGVSFALAYDPGNQILSGRSALGALRVVPSYVLLDAQGRIAGRHVGAMTEAQLDAFAARARP